MWYRSTFFFFQMNFKQHVLNNFIYNLLNCARDLLCSFFSEILFHGELTETNNDNNKPGYVALCPINLFRLPTWQATRL